jgi:transcription initiation factor IIE alpha subunit
MDVDEAVSYEVGKMLCPKCGKEMEQGYLQIGSSVGLGVFWFDRLFEHGQQFTAKKKRLMSVPAPRNIEGFRCPKCKVVLFEYGAEKQRETED